MIKRYEVQTHTLCQGWLNCWTIDEVPETFATMQEAESAIVEHQNERLEDGLDIDDELRIVEVTL